MIIETLRASQIFPVPFARLFLSKLDRIIIDLKVIKIVKFYKNMYTYKLF